MRIFRLHTGRGLAGAWVLLMLAVAPRVSAELPSARLPLEEVLHQRGVDTLEACGTVLTARNGVWTLAFEGNMRRVVANGLQVLMNEPATLQNGAWMVSEADVRGLLTPLLRPAVALSGARMRTVVLDPGHGGMDSGAVGRRGVLESRLTLEIAERVRAKLELCGIHAALTRARDEDVSLTERGARARRHGADLLVSIHANHSSNPDARGVETYVLPAPGSPASSAVNGASPRGVAGDVRSVPGNAHDPVSALLAYFVHCGVLTQTGAADRGIRRARFLVLREADCPAILVECGFVSSVSEERQLAGRPYRDAVAEGIGRGILTLMSRAAELEEPEPAPLPAGGLSARSATVQAR